MKIAYLIPCLFLNNLGFSQALVNRQSLITVTESTVVSIYGDVMNDGEISNEGALFLFNDWSSYGNYHSDSGRIILCGKEKQSIKHLTSPLSQLFIDGDGQKIIEEDISITTRLHLESGILSSSTNKKIVISSNALVSGGSEKSFVEGPLYQEGEGYRFFPIGRNNRYYPVELLKTEGNNLLLGIEVIDLEPVMKLSPALDKAYYPICWQQSVLTGSYKGSLIKLPFRDLESPSLISKESLAIIKSKSFDDSFTKIEGTRYLEDLNSIVSTSPIEERYFTVGIIADERMLFVPNVFSPKAGDPENRVVKIYGKSISAKGFLFRIYNKWGDMVYESTSLEGLSTLGWNGVNFKTGRMEEIGIYKYTLKAIFENGEKVSKTGSILLLE